MPLNVRDFGAMGDGVTDDTAAIQAALDVLMEVYRGGTLYFPRGIYIVKYTLQLVGDPAHNYTIIGDGGGLTSITTLKWAGPAKCTMLDCWGLNWTQFKGLIFDGGGTNLHIGNYSDPAVGTLGAGCATWFHTNQFNTVSHPGIGRHAATFNVFFDDCTWQSVCGGIYAACAIGDGPYSPGNVTVDKNGTITRYEVETVTPRTVGENAVDTVVTTTLASDAAMGAKSFTLKDVTRFIVNRAIIISKAGSDPWCGRITNIDITLKLVTASDNQGGGLTFAALAGASVYNVFPNAVAESRPAGSVVTGSVVTGSVVTIHGQVQNSECDGFYFNRCNFAGGGWDTTVSNQYNYAGLAIYSGSNTEQFGFRDTNFFIAAGVFGIYSPYRANNEWFLENVSFGTFSGAALFLGINNAAKVTMYQCSTESNTGCGYFCIDSAGSGVGTLTIDSCEVVYSCIANPFTSCIGVGGPTKIMHTWFENTFSEVLGCFRCRPQSSATVI